VILSNRLGSNIAEEFPASSCYQGGVESRVTGKGAPVICEICVDSVAGVRAARAAAADRVELCADLLEGGTTPSRGMIRQARTIAGIGLNVMIRPRGGDFLFDDDEFAIMEADIDTAKTEGADGVVIGLLTADGAVDDASARTDCSRPTPLSDVSPGVRHDARSL
jgi:copper homeostasis protein